MTATPKKEAKPTRPTVVGRDIIKAAETPPPYGEKKPSEIPDIHSGDRVHHKKFGDGTIVSIGDGKFTVRFKGGMKTLGTQIVFGNGIVTVISGGKNGEG